MVELKQEPQKLTAFLSGEIDHHRAKELREAIDFAVREQYPPTVILDFRRVTFMDSSGIGLIMGRYKIMQPLGGQIILRDPAPHISRVLRLAGMERLAAIRNEPVKEAVK